MTELQYELPESVLPNLERKEAKHNGHDPGVLHVEPKAKSKLTLRWLFQPEEHADIAVWSLSVTFGAVWALIVGMFTLMAMNDTGRSFTNLLEAIYPGYKIPDSPVAFDALINLGIGVVYAFVHGWLFGLVVGLLYHRFTRPRPYGVRFKGRIQPGAPAVLVRQGNKQAKAQKDQAYTVLIVANPFIQTSAKLIPVEQDAVRVDPIMNEPELFQMKVACILASLAYNKTIAPFLDRMRFIALFDPEQAEVPKITDEDGQKEKEEKLEPMKKRALCLENQIDFLVEPAQRIYHEPPNSEEDRLLNYLKQYPELGRVDVVFAITASETHTRSSSRFMIEKQPAQGQADFTYCPSAEAKEYSGYYNAPLEVPGMVAYSAWDLRLKTPVHEFAHAMSSNMSGLIDDEYHDGALQKSAGVFVLNKHHGAHLDKNNNGTLEPSELPEVFAEIREYGHAHKFGTDKLRAMPEGWKSYVPQRPHYQMPCTMDESDDVHDFDLLLQHFITKRLEAKV